MAQLPFAIGQMLHAAGIRQQMMEAVNALEKVLRANGNDAPRSAKGRACKICEIWQRRFQTALRSEIPDWGALAAFRSITDFNIPLERLSDMFPPRPSGGNMSEPCPEHIDDPEKIWRAYQQYFERYRDFYSGKLQLQGEAETHFLQNLHQCEPLLGGQAGNIAWIWHCMGANALTYVPYPSHELAELPRKLPALSQLKLIQLENGQSEVTRLIELHGRAGIRKSDGTRVWAPSGGRGGRTTAPERLLVSPVSPSVLPRGRPGDVAASLRAAPWGRASRQAQSHRGGRYDVCRLFPLERRVRSLRARTVWDRVRPLQTSCDGCMALCKELDHGSPYP